MDPHRFSHPSPLTPQSATSFSMHPSALHRDQPPTPTSATTPQGQHQPSMGQPMGQMYHPGALSLHQQHGIPSQHHQQQHQPQQHHGRINPHIDPRLDSMLDPRLSQMLSPTLTGTPPMIAMASMAPTSATMVPTTLLAPHPQPRHAQPLRPIAARAPSTGGMGMPGQALAPAPPGGPRNGVAGNSLNAAQSATPQKDSDGKFPCPSCNKTYLHAKHLKRHLLRHTGDRPYQCILCKDTFSRSDILKRHFQKCSIRRGNPTGATHLSQHHANQQAKAKAAQAQQAANASSTSSPITPHGPGPNSLQASPTSPHHRRNSSLTGAQSKACDQCQRLKLRCDFNQPCERCRTRSSECTYSRTAKRNSTSTQGGARRRTIPDLPSADSMDGLMTTQPDFSHHDGYTLSPTAMGRPPEDGGGDFGLHRQSLSSLPGSRAANVSTSSFNLPPQITHANQELDWSSLLHVGESFMEPFYVDAAIGQPPKMPDGTKSFSGAEVYQGTYNGVGAGGDFSSAGMGGILGSFSGWNNLSVQPSDPFQSKCEALIQWLWPTNTNQDPTRSPIKHEEADVDDPDDDMDRAVRQWVTVDHIRHFIHLYCLNFQGHFPLIHIPTFNIHLSDNGLLMTLACIGAVYSDRGIKVDDVRYLMGVVRQAMSRSHAADAVLKSLSLKDNLKIATGRPAKLDEMQAMIMMHILATWHGNREQRDRARQIFPEVVSMARYGGFMQPLGDDGFSSGHWNWTAWVEQEKRNRIAYAVYLLDTAYVIYFNTRPIIEPYEVRLCLPGDDAAWEATNAAACSNMLGLNGPGAQSGNITGSRRTRQLEFAEAMAMLLDPQKDMKPGSTNAYSKFILIHALHMHIWMSQHDPTSYLATHIKPVVGHGVNGDAASLLNSPLDTTMKKESGASVETNRHNPAAESAARIIHSALQKWKRVWDTDLAVQFPSPSARVGFCRDGLPFYWLAKLFLAKNRSKDWKHSNGDERTVLLVKKMLKHVRSFIFDGEGRIDLQGAVAGWDESYGVDELTFDMKLLFKPIGEVEGVTSPGLGW